MNAIPKVYAPRGLGPNQQRWLERKFPQITHKRVERKHACGCSPYLCEVCNPRRKEPK
jgi:hypothetical protein